MLHKLAWLQLITEKRRLLAALAGIAFAVLLQLMQFGFRDALFTSGSVLHSHLNADIVLVSTQYRYVAQTGIVTQRRLYQALGLPQVASVAHLYLSPVSFKNPETHQDRQIFAVAFDPDDAVINAPGVAEGAAAIKVPDVVLFDEISHQDFGPVAAMFRETKSVTTEVGGRRMKIAGLFQLGVSFAATGHLIMSDITFRRVFNRPEGVFDVGLIRLKPGSNIAEAQNALVALLPSDVQVLTRQQFADLEQAYWDKVSPIGFIFLMGSVIGLTVGLVIVYQILYTDVTDHLQEYATLKAMGFSNRHFYMVVIEEALILSICGYPIGYLLSLLIYRAGRDATHLPLQMTVERAVGVLALTIMMCTFSGMMAMRKLTSADPAEVF
jgi:putative ABC transport system permease protein